MTDNQLVRGILEDISIKVCQGSSYEGRRSSSSRTLVLLCGSDYRKAEVLKAMDAAARECGPLTVALTGNAESFFSPESLKQREAIGRVLVESDFKDMDRWLKNIGRVWCPNITQNTLVKVSRGITDSLGPCLLWWALSKGIPVQLAPESASHTTASLPENHPMKGIVREALKQVLSFGAVLAAEGKAEATEVVVKKEAGVQFVKLIHEGNLLSVAGTGKSLALAKGQLITPAARDMAKTMGIEIK